MNQTVLVRGARQLLTLLGPNVPRRGADMRELHMIADGSVIIQNGMIVEVGPTRRIERLAIARRAEVIDAAGKVVMPGFVDSHTRLLEGEPEWLENRDQSVTRKNSKQRMAVESMHLIRDFVRHGTTTVESKSGGGRDQSAWLRELRTLRELDEKTVALVASYFGARACPAQFRGDESGYARWLTSRVLPAISRRKLARFVDVAIGEGALQPATARLVLGAARRLDFLLRVHAPAARQAQAVLTAVEFEAGSIDGLSRLDDRSIELLSGSGVVATLLPAVAFARGTAEYPAARGWIDRGVAVSLATGFDSSHAGTCSMPATISIACSQMKMEASEAIVACTINAACALGRGSAIGSLAPGKQADMIVLHCNDYRELAGRFGVNPAAMVIRRGELIYPRVGAI